jgi:hypothetical protein
MRRGVFILALIPVLFSGTPLFAQDSFTCGTHIVVPGDSTAKVIIYCGEPSYKEVLSTGEEGPKIENWYYNCGSDGFIYALRFVDGVLQTIQLNGFGSGPSDCAGARDR